MITALVITALIALAIAGAIAIADATWDESDALDWDAYPDDY